MKERSVVNPSFLIYEILSAMDENERIIIGINEIQSRMAKLNKKLKKLKLRREELSIEAQKLKKVRYIDCCFSLNR